jgi:hypothetical protein
MKTTFIFLFGFLLGISVASVVLYHLCRPHHPPGMADQARILSHLTSRLNLTPDQQEKVTVLLKQMLPQTESLRQEGDQKFKSLRDAFNSQLRSLLNPDQQKTLDEMISQHDKRLGEANHSFGCSGPSMNSEPPTTSPVSGK